MNPGLFGIAGGMQSALQSAQMELRGTYASRPPAGVLGRVYMPTDSPIWWFDDALKWNPFLGTDWLTAPPAAASWALKGFAGSGATAATIVDAKGAVLLTSGLNAGVAGQAAFIAPGFSAPYTCIARIIPPSGIPNSSNWGLGWGDNSGGNYQTVGVQTNAFTGLNWTSGGAAAAGPSQTASNSNSSLGGPWWKLQDDNTNRIWWLSADGFQWYKIASVARTNSVATPDRLCIHVDAQSSTLAMFLKLVSWSVVSGVV